VWPDADPAAEPTGAAHVCLCTLGSSGARGGARQPRRRRDPRRRSPGTAQGGRASARRAADGLARSDHLAFGRRCSPAALPSPAPGGGGTRAPPPSMARRIPAMWRGKSRRRDDHQRCRSGRSSTPPPAGPPPRAPRPCLLRPSHEDAMCRRPRRRPPDLPGQRRRTGPAAHLPLQAAHM
jgi:hypothetical protein